MELVGAVCDPCISSSSWLNASHDLRLDGVERRGVPIEVRGLVGVPTDVRGETRVGVPTEDRALARALGVLGVVMCCARV